MKKFISMLAGVVMASSLVAVTAFAAGGNPNWSMTIDNAEVEVGDIVTVQLGTEKKTLGADVVNVYYDTDKFEFVDIADADGCLFSKEEAEFKFAAGAYLEPGHNPAMKTVAFMWVGTGAEKTMKANEEVAFITFKAIEAGEAVFSLKEQSSGTDGFKGDVDAQTVTVKGSEPVTPPAPTASVAIKAAKKTTDANWVAEYGNTMFWGVDFANAGFNGEALVKIFSADKERELIVKTPADAEVNGEASFGVFVIVGDSEDALGLTVTSGDVTATAAPVAYADAE